MSSYHLSSDDSIFDIDLDEDEVVSSPAPSLSTPQSLPNWAPPVDPDYGAKHASSSSQGRYYSGYHPQHGAHSFPSYGAGNRASSFRIQLNDNFMYYKENSRNEQVGKNYPSVHFNTSRSSSLSQKDYEEHMCQKSERRVLPPSFQHLPHRDYNSRYNDGSSHTHGIWKSNDSSGRGKSICKGDDDDVVIMDSSRRILPPSLTRARPALPATSNSVDPLLRTAMAEGPTGNDERLIYQAALQELSQPKSEANIPDGLLSVPLLRHQKIALQWMLQKETNSLHCLGGILADDQGLGKTISMIALIQMQKLAQSKSKSGDQSGQKTEPLLLDVEDEATGKADAENIEQNGARANSSVQTVPRKRPAAGTLVVCPATVLRQWARELDDKVGNEAKLTVLVYHGGNRTKDPAELAKYDVVLTTYAIVLHEVPKQSLIDEDGIERKSAEEHGLSFDFSVDRKRKNPSNTSKEGKKGGKGIDSYSIDSDTGPLGRVSWLRVVLDEAQTIKNHRTQVARACSGLRARTRWCLSGTPIQNVIEELFSYFRFLKYDPYGKYKSFLEGVKIPISRNPVHGYMKLQAILRAVMLRRTKDTLLNGVPIISLPPKRVELKRLCFTPEEQFFYFQLEKESRRRFKEYAAAGTLNKNYANILLMLLRLRQACDHPLLAKEFIVNSAQRTPVQMTKKLSNHILHDLETSSSICCACSDPPENAVVTKCGHVFCYQCVVDFLSGDDNTCPAPRCKEQLSDNVIFSKPTLKGCLNDDVDANLPNYDLLGRSSSMTNKYISSKIRAALEILQSNSKSGNPKPNIDLDDPAGCNQDSMETDAQPHKTVDSTSELPVKTIVFSQWTGMLDLFEISLNKACIQFRRLDGAMSLAARDRAVREFNTDPEVTVMLMSLKVGNLGLNMVAACHVILFDLWWNPATEDQAVDRAHRIGQTRTVTVSRLTIKDTVEDRILALQEEKRKMVASAYGEDKSGRTGAGLTIGDLKYLFNIPA